MLTNEQIQKIDTLCKDEGICFYDLRLEITDHVAEGVENKMLQDPTISFDVALKEAALSVGVFGFSKIVKDREQEVLNSVKGKSFKYFLEFLTIPKIIASFLLFVGLASPRMFFGISGSKNIFIIALCTAGVILSGLLYTLKFKPSHEPLLTLPSKNIYFGFVAPMLILSISNSLRGFKNDSWFNSGWFVLLYAALATLSVLFTLAWSHVYAKLYNQTFIKYPLAFKN